MKLLKKILTELTRTRAIQFVSYETEEEENARLALEFRQRKNKLATENYRNLMNERLIPFCRDMELTRTGMLLGDNVLFPIAHQMFLQAKRDGRIDELNRVR